MLYKITEDMYHVLKQLEKDKQITTDEKSEILNTCIRRV